MAIRAITSIEFLNNSGRIFDFLINRYVSKQNRKYFMENASIDDTYIAIIAPNCRELWNRQKHHYKDWILYEGPLAHNQHHGTKVPTNNFVVLEKPK